MTRVLHPRFAARRGAVRTTTWWARAWLRAVEEAAYAEADLRRGRVLARSGGVGQVSVDDGHLYAAVADRDHVHTVTVAVPVLDAAGTEAFVETVAAESGRIAALLAGDLPFGLVEHAEEAGVELLPYGGELETACTCDAWVDPCPHALAVLVQVAWLVEADPLVLLQLRGLDRDQLLARLHARAPDPEVDPDLGQGLEQDLEQGLDAALRAARLLELLAVDPTRPVDHLF